MNDKITWQAHRGGGLYEAPDNTMAALRYGWGLGAVPEVDIRLTADNELICLHDNTLARTTDAPDSIANTPVRELTLAEILKYDAGKKFDHKFTGETALPLRDAFEAMKSDPARELYVDIKNYDKENFPCMLAVFAAMTARYNLAERLIVASRDYGLNLQIGQAVKGVRLMQWIGDWTSQDHRVAKLCKFEELVGKNFTGLSGVQIHLELLDTPADGWWYDLSQADLQHCLDTCSATGVFFQVFPFRFNEMSICDLIHLGITSFATDEPARFKQILDAEIS